MSYICLIANKNGVVVAGDSRLTLEPQLLHLHYDKAQKVFSDPEQNMVWACCGLTVFLGMNYFSMCSRILRQSHRSMGSRLNQISKILGRATRIQHRLGRKNSVFTLLLATVKDGAVQVQTLDVVNGKATLKKHAAPVMIQSGWNPFLHQPKPPVSYYKEETLEQLISRAKDRCLWAMRKDGRLTRTEKKHIQTIGGNVRVAYLSTAEDVPS